MVPGLSIRRSQILNTERVYAMCKAAYLSRGGLADYPQLFCVNIH